MDEEAYIDELTTLDPSTQVDRAIEIGNMALQEQWSDDSMIQIKSSLEFFLKYWKNQMDLGTAPSKEEGQSAVDELEGLLNQL